MPKKTEKPQAPERPFRVLRVVLLNPANEKRERFFFKRIENGQSEVELAERAVANYREEKGLATHKKRNNGDLVPLTKYEAVSFTESEFKSCFNTPDGKFSKAKEKESADFFKRGENG